MSKLSGFKVAVEIIIKSNKTILLTKTADEEKTETFNKDIWSVPAGKVELTEKTIDGAIREAKEETNLDINIIKELDCRYVDIIKGNKKQPRLMYTYLAEVDGDIQNIKLNEEHSEYKWATKEDCQNLTISQHLVPFIKKSFEY